MKNNRDLYIGFICIIMFILFLLTVLIVSIVTPKQCNDYTKYEYDKGYVPARCVKWNK